MPPTTLFRSVVDGRLIGRGAVDMKGAIGAFVAAVADFLADGREDFTGSISLLVTGDEEGPAINGTVKVLDWMKAKGEIPDHCLVGEPTNRDALGETVKIGQPMVDGAKVVAKIVEQGRHKKVIVFKKKKRKGYQVKKGHRQMYTALTIETISA